MQQQLIPFPLPPPRISELRSIELLDDLCDDLKKDYDYNSTSGAWESTSGKPASGDG